MYKNLNDILIKMNNGGSYSIIFAEQKETTYNLITSETSKIKSLIHGDTEKLQSLCLYCKDYYSFTFNTELYLLNSNGQVQKENNITYAKQYSPHYGTSYAKTSSTNKNFNDAELLPITFYGKYYLNCDMNKSHRYEMYMKYIFDGNGKLTIIKLGQDPNSIYLRKDHSNEYKVELSKFDAIDDYHNAITSEINNLAAGSCTYLRRILEKMVNTYILEVKPDFDKVTEKKSFSDLYNIVKDKFDPVISPQMGKLYKLLSQSIHVLTEEQINVFHHLLKAVVNLQLNFIKQNRIKEENKIEILRELDNL